ncbi:MAG: hypothetical protein LBQ60_15280 [Bacteroidales bacterium]|jgi:hypothetical protein|nr:hypothetical protein [Bacteroidales bacterium]
MNPKSEKNIGELINFFVMMLSIFVAGCSNNPNKWTIDRKKSILLVLKHLLDNPPFAKVSPITKIQRPSHSKRILPIAKKQKQTSGYIFGHNSGKDCQARVKFTLGTNNEVIQHLDRLKYLLRMIEERLTIDDMWFPKRQ